MDSEVSFTANFEANSVDLTLVTAITVVVKVPSQ